MRVCAVYNIRDEVSIRQIYNTSHLIRLELFKIQTSRSCSGGLDDLISKSDVWLTVHRNSVWIRKTN